MSIIANICCSIAISSLGMRQFLGEIWDWKPLLFDGGSYLVFACISKYFKWLIMLLAGRQFYEHQTNNILALSYIVDQWEVQGCVHDEATCLCTIVNKTYEWPYTFSKEETCATSIIASILVGIGLMSSGVKRIPM